MVEDKQYNLKESELKDLAYGVEMTAPEFEAYLREVTPIEPLNRQEVMGILLDYNDGESSTEQATTDILSLIPTPIEPSDDANLFPNARSMTKEEVKREKEYKAKHSKVINLTPQQKQFNEAEIREILVKNSTRITRDAYKPKGKKEITVLDFRGIIDVNFKDVIKQLSTLTPKDNIHYETREEAKKNKTKITGRDSSTDKVECQDCKCEHNTGHTGKNAHLCKREKIDIDKRGQCQYLVEI